MVKILLVDDDAQLREVVQIGFRLQWPESRVVVAADGPAALRAFAEQRPDVVLLDVALPGQDGFAVLRAIRRQSAVPVIMLTARGEELDQVRGLELGADEYVVKPFSLLALLARVKAVLRRSTLGTAGAQPYIVVGDLTIDGQGHQVTLGGEPVPLTPVEYQLLSLLAQNAGRVLPHQVLLDGVWGDDYDAPRDYLKAFISRLRAKLERQGGPHHIETVRGVGYRFVGPNKGAADPGA